MPEVFNNTSTPPISRMEAKFKSLVARSSVLRSHDPTHNPLAAFCIMPPKVGFDVQHDDERVLLLLRQHPIVNLGWILISIVLVFLPLLILPLTNWLVFLPFSFRTVLVLSWYVITFGFALEQFVMWYFNIYIITDERVIDMDFYSLLFKRISETKLDHVEDITAASGGVVQSMFDYGDVQIQTAAEIPEIEFERVPHPAEVTKLISELIDKEEVQDKGTK